MTLLDDMRTGRGGVKFALPERFNPIDIQDDFALFQGPTPGQSWTVNRSHVQLDLRLEHDEAHRRDIARHTRALFDAYSRNLVRLNRAPRVTLRTEDPEWSPLVSVERVQVGGHPALTVIHRMSYQPGNEAIMGHLLVPFGGGLFEIRSIAQPPMTGIRESMLLMKAMSESPGEDPDVVMKRLGQAYYDDPLYDILLPDHPLSVVRADLREILEDGLVSVTRPAKMAPAGEAEVPELNCAVTPPRRFVRIPEIDYPQWSRVSFACTDGVELLSMARTALPAGEARERLLQLAEQVVRAPPEGATDVHVEVRVVGGSEDRPQVEAYRSYGMEGGEPGQSVLRWLVDDDGEAVMLALGSPRCVPKQELLDEIAAVAESWRPLGKQGKPSPRRPNARDAPPSEPAAEEAPVKKPWWRIW